MKQWFSTPLGEYTLQIQDRFLKPALSRRFGYHLLQLGCADIPLYESSPIGHKFNLCLSSQTKESWVCANPESLPLASESVDLVILHHALENTENPHQVLREVSRVLIAGGQIFICGFNPISMWGLRKLFNFNQYSPWNNRLLSSRRLSDWLKLLEFQVEDIRHGGYCLPINSARWIRYSSVLENLASKLNWPTGGLYMISARKQVAPLTPIQSRWQRFPAPSNVGIPITDNASKISNKISTQ